MLVLVQTEGIGFRVEALFATFLLSLHGIFCSGDVGLSLKVHRFKRHRFRVSSTPAITQKVCMCKPTYMLAADRVQYALIKNCALCLQHTKAHWRCDEAPHLDAPGA